MFQITKILTGAIHSLSPHHCPLCESLSENGYVCRQCMSALTLNAQACSMCALPLAAKHQAFCGACMKSPPDFDRAFAPLVYDNALAPIISEFKDRCKLGSGSQLSQLLCSQLCQLDETKPDLIIPVPSHWQTHLWRGFNPAEEIAKHLSKSLHVPILHALIKTRKTQKQQNITKQERQLNLRGAFSLKDSDKPLLKGLSDVALIDDVVTTGATANHCARILKSAGVKTVRMWSLARTPTPS